MDEFDINEFATRLKLTAYESYGNLKSLGEIAGIDNISIYTQKKASEPRAKVLYKLAKVGVDVNYLLTGKKIKDTYKEEYAKVLKKQVNKLIDTIDDISDKRPD